MVPPHHHHHPPTRTHTHTNTHNSVAAFLSGREARAADNVSLYLQDTAQRHQSGGKSPGTEIQKDIDGFKWLFLDWMKSAFRWFEDGWGCTG